jgi:hypothetical protein
MLYDNVTRQQGSLFDVSLRTFGSAADLVAFLVPREELAVKNKVGTGSSRGRFRNRSLVS